MSKKLYFLVGMALLAFAACTDSDDFKDQPVYVDKSDIQLNSNTSELASRMIIADNSTKATRAAATPAPEVPADAIDLVEAYETYYASQGNEWWQPERQNVYLPLEAGKTYVVPEGKTFSDPLNLNNANNITVYVAGTWSLKSYQGNISKTVIVLPTGTYNVQSWNEGELTIGDGNNELVKVWGKINPMKDGEVKTLKALNVKAKGELNIYAGSYESFDVSSYSESQGGLFTENGAKFYCEVPFTTERFSSNGGELHFANTYFCLYDCFLNSATTVTYDKCAEYANKLSLSGGNVFFYVNEMLKAKNFSLDGSKIYLNQALLDVTEHSTLYATGNEGRIECTSGEDRSIFRTGSVEFNAYQPTNRQITTLYGCLDLLSEDIQGGGESLDADKLSATAINAGVKFNSEDAYLPSTDCRAQIGSIGLEINELIAILPPTGEHPYSATGLAFNGDYLYLGWHANANFDYEDDATWGAYMDVIKIDKYNPEGSLFEQTLYNAEMKYNHTYFYNNKIYAASTSNKIGAALTVIPVGEDGRFATDVNENVERINLVGASANCIEKLGSDFITISGWQKGGINVFPVTAVKAENTYFEGAYMGKYVYYNENKGVVIVLHDTDKGLVEVYNGSDANAMFKGSPSVSFEAGEIYPVDGKNVCIGDDDYIYVCRGNNKLAVFDYTGKKVAETSASANGIDVDDTYIYLASGNGVKVYKKSDITGKDIVTLTPIASSKIKEATNIQDVKGSLLTQSSNFIKKGADGKLYVAYGVYGLRIYELKVTKQ